MTTPDTESDEAAPAISSRSEFDAALHWALRRSLAADARRIVCADVDFAAWPLDSTELHTLWTAWLRRPQRRLVLLARDDAAALQRHARFVAWRRDWAHAIEGHRLPADSGLELPSLYVDDVGTSVQLIDAVHWRGRASADGRTARLWRDELDALLQRSEPGFPVHQLGL